MATMEKPRPKQAKKKTRHKSEESEESERATSISEASNIQEFELPDVPSLEIPKTPETEVQDEEVEGKKEVTNTVVVEETGKTEFVNLNTSEINDVIPSVPDLEVTNVISKVDEKTLEKAVKDCLEVTDALKNIKQPLPMTEDSKVYVEAKNVAFGSKNYKELSTALDKLKIEDSKVKKTQVEAAITPFTFAEIENVFGVQEMTASRRFAAEFEKNEMQAPALTHPLYEALMEYQRARSKLILNQKEIGVMLTECTDKQKSLWVVKSCTKKNGARCDDGCYLDAYYKYQEAILQKNFMGEFQNRLNLLREKATETHSQHSHAQHLQKLQINELIWISTVCGVKYMKESLRVLFWVLRTSAWGYDKELRWQLRAWTASLSRALLQKENTLKNLLFLLHHILRVSQGIGWAVPLIQLSVANVSDVSKALCVLEAILTPPKKIQEDNGRRNHQRISESSENQQDESYDALLALEATDESAWLVVDSDGEGADLEAAGLGALRENHMVALLRQIPFQEVFSQLMVVRSHGTDLVFCGGTLGGGPVLRVFAAVRILLSTIRAGLLTHSSYQELSKELCRLTLHSVMYCTDLWEIASGSCEASLVQRLSTEYNSVFLAGWGALEAASPRECSTMFLSEMPFKLVWQHTVDSIYHKTMDTLIVSDSVWCYYTLVCISSMATSRNDYNFTINAAKQLLQLGFTSDFAELGCGEWCRALCGTILRHLPSGFGPLLAGLPRLPPDRAAWLRELPLGVWRPHAGELVQLLDSWRENNAEAIPHLIKNMDWSVSGGLDMHTQRNVAAFLAITAQQLTQPRSVPPEWIWECLLLLKLHCYDWDCPPSQIPSPEDIQGLSLTGRCHCSSVVILLTTSWGYTVPLVFQNAAPLLVKMANAAKFAEIAHILFYLIPILQDCPDAIAQCKIFKELLMIMFRAEKTYTKMAARLMTKDSRGPCTKLLTDMIQTQLKNFSYFKLSSPRTLLSVWVHWLTSIDNWQNDWIAIHLLDVVLGACFLHHEAMAEAANIFGSFIQPPTSPQSPTSSSGFGSWLWTSSSPYRGLVQCSTEAPYVWQVSLWTEHMAFESVTGLWQRLVDKLASRNKNSKVNIDKTLKSVGGGDNSSLLVIYRALQCAISTPISHPINSLIWQIFFYLYMDVSTPYMMESAPTTPIGPLFFHGLINSRLLTRARSRLEEIKSYHEAKVKEICDKAAQNNEVTENQKQYHSKQAQLMDAFHYWLDDDFVKDIADGIAYTKPFSHYMQLLISRQNVTWTETIDTFEWNKLRPPPWPAAILQDGVHVNISASPQGRRSKTPDASPSDRILYRLRTYESPVLESKDPRLKNEPKPLVDPTVCRDVNAVFKIMDGHLKEIGKLSKKYAKTCENLVLIDQSLCEMIPNLYEQRVFSKSFNKSCGDKCERSVTFIIKGIESIIKDSVNVSIGYNRKNHQSCVDKALEPYEDLANHTAVISKLSELACRKNIENLNDGGVTLFNMVLNSIKDENTKFPPANEILVTVATQLGECFVSASGSQCVNLVTRAASLGSAGLVGGLLRPSNLSTDEMLQVYSAISTTVSDAHMAFSYLSKFHIPAWLHNSRPHATERSRFIALVCEALGAAGCEPPPARLMLHELMCVHLSRVLAWEFPVHLGQVLTTLFTLTLERKLPPDTWQHCITVIETYPHLLSHQQACEQLEQLGRQWWSVRAACGAQGLPSRYSMYGGAGARLGALLASTVLSTAMLHQPPLLTHHIASVTFSAIRSYLEPWLVVWWSEAAPPLMPWLPADTQAPDIMLAALQETILYCSVTLPGSSADLLRLTWQWYVSNYAHPAVGTHVLNRVHRALEKLPWESVRPHWVSYADLETISKLSNQSLPLSHAFALECLAGHLWTPWVLSLPAPLQPSALHLLLPVLFTLAPEKAVLDDAMQLPWELLQVELFEEFVGWFMLKLSTSTEPFHSSRLVPLLCACSGLVSGSSFSSSWQAKRACLVRSWVGAVSSLTLSRQGLPQPQDKRETSEAIAASIGGLLTRIETTVTTMDGSELQKASECSVLLLAAVQMLNMMFLLDVAQPEWISWINRTSQMCVTSLIGCLLQVTQRDLFANLAEQALLVYFKQNGSWELIVNMWKDNCIIPVEYLISCSCLLTAMATYRAMQGSRSQDNSLHQLNKNILQNLHSFEPLCACEKETCLWVCHIVDKLEELSLSDPQSMAVVNQSLAILDKWSQEPSWGLFTAIGLVQNKAPSLRFRIIAKYAICVVNQKLKTIQESQLRGSPSRNTESSAKAISSFEAMVDHKSCSDIKYMMSRYVDSLRDQKISAKELTKHLAALCSELYSDTNFLGS